MNRNNTLARYLDKDRLALESWDWMQGAGGGIGGAIDVVSTSSLDFGAIQAHQLGEPAEVTSVTFGPVAAEARSSIEVAPAVQLAVDAKPMAGSYAGLRCCCMGCISPSFGPGAGGAGLASGQGIDAGSSSLALGHDARLNQGDIPSSPDLVTTAGVGNGVTESREASSTFDPKTEGGSNQSVQNLLTGKKWGGAIGSGVSLTYSLAKSSSVYGYVDEVAPGRYALVTEQDEAAALAVEALSAISGLAISNVPIADTATQAGDIRFGNTSITTDNFKTAGAYPPGSTGRSGDIWFGPDYPEFKNPVVGGYGYLTFIHELAHALGLRHPHEPGTEGGAPTLPALAGQDQLKYSIMSYRSYDGQPLGGYTGDYYPTTPMINDVLALQFLYGKNTSFHSGPDVYSWPAGTSVFETIWDADSTIASVTDLISAANQAEGVKIFLTPGKWSEIGKAFSNGQAMVRDNLTIAYGVQIENATGSAFDDTLEGNEFANSLVGGNGNDWLSGLAGNDTLVGGIGNDTYDIDVPTDVVTEEFGAGTDLVNVGLSAAVTYSVPANVENAAVTASAAVAVNLLGNELDNALTGNAATNTLVGGAGNDTLNGGQGVDSLAGGPGNDVYVLSVPADVVNETATGSSGVDRVELNFTATASYTLPLAIEDASAFGTATVGIVGNTQANRLTGNAADNLLDGGTGIDTLAGGPGDDHYVLDVPNDAVQEAIDEGIDLLELTFTSATTYTLPVNVEKAIFSGALPVHLVGNGLDNELTGGDGANSLTGFAGNDTLFGMGGADTLDGGTGADTLVGGTGDDTLSAVDGNDQLSGGDGNDRYAVSRVDYDFGTTANTPTYYVFDFGGANDILQITDTNSGPVLDDLSDLVFQLKGNDLWIDLDIPGAVLVDDDEGRIVINSQALSGNAVESLVLRDRTGTLIGDPNHPISLISVQAALGSLPAGTDQRLTLSKNVGLYGLLVNGAGGTAMSDAGALGGNWIFGTPTSATAPFGNDTLTGTVGNDNFLLSTGRDLIDGGLGTDKLVGDMDLTTSSFSSLAYAFGGSGLRSSFNTSYASLTTDLATAPSSYRIALGSLGDTTATGVEQFQISLTGTIYDDLLIFQNGTRYNGGAGSNDTFYANWSAAIAPITWANDPTLPQTINGVSVQGLERLLISTGSGNDSISNLLATGNGNDDIHTGLGNDTVDGGPGGDLIDTGDGDDQIVMSAGADVVQGGTGTDKLVGDMDLSTSSFSSLAYAFGGSGLRSSFNTSYASLTTDLAAAPSSYRIALGSLGDTTATGVEQFQISLTGTNYDDLLIFQNGTRYNGGAGTNDTFYANWSAVPTPIVWANDPALPQVVNGVSVRGLERLLISTGSGNDSITNVLATGNGNDDIHTGLGNDTVDGGPGGDLIDTGDGNDQIVLSGGADVVQGGAGTDKLVGDMDLTTSSFSSLAYAFGGSGLRSSFNTSYASLTADLATAPSSYRIAMGSLGDTTATGVEQFQINLTGTIYDDLLIFQNGTRYNGGAGSNDTFYANWSAATAPIVWANDPLLTQTVNGVSVQGLERLLISTGSGNDSISNVLATGNGNDDIHTGLGNDTVDGGRGGDLIDTSDGDDQIVLSAGADVVQGGAGTDKLVGDMDLTASSFTSVSYAFAGGGFRSSFNTTYASLTADLAGANASYRIVLGSLGDTTATGIEQFQISLTGTIYDDLLIFQNGTRYNGGAGSNDTFYANWSAATAPIVWANDPALPQVVNGVSVQGLERLLIGTGSGNDSISNLLTATDDELGAGAGNDTLDGGDGDDQLTPGTGIDLAIGGAGFDSVVLAAPFASYVISRPNAVDLVLVSAAASQNVTVRDAESIVFSDGARLASTLVPSAVGPTAGPDTLVGDAGDNLIDGLAGNDSISGLAGNDTLIGGSGTDTLVGGPGNDQFNIDVLTDSVVEALGEGTDLVNVGPAVAGTYTLPPNIDNATVTSGATVAVSLVGNALNNALTGNAAANSLTGDAGNDTLSGAEGDDRLTPGTGIDLAVGGAGTDTLVLPFSFASFSITRPNATDLLLVNAAASQNVTIREVESIAFADGTRSVASIVATIATAGADTLIGDAGDNLIDGLAGNDSISGLAGNDTLIGGSGTDTLVGGPGNDQFNIDVLTDSAVEALGEGTDLVNVGPAVAGTYTLPPNIDNATVTSGATVAVSLVGNALNNALTGNAAANSLTGDAGNDTLDGGSGNDQLTPGTGVDLVVGGPGTDSVVLSANFATYAITRANATDLVLVNAAAPQNVTIRDVESVVFADGARLVSAIEPNASGATAGPDVLVGDAGDNLIDGLAGNDTISGLAGHDTLIGGAGTDSLIGGPGDDVFRIDVLADTVVEALDEGVDRVELGLALAGTYTLPPQVEDATVTSAAAVHVVGNASNNLLVGNAAGNSLVGADGDDTLDGGAGLDTMAGGAGNDLYRLNTVADTVNETAAGSDGYDSVELSLSLAGTYTLPAGIEWARLADAAALAASLIGNELGNNLWGNAGNNTLDGGAGFDFIAGGAGNDRIVGGLDHDWVLYSGSPAGVQVNLATGVATGEGIDTLVGIEGVRGSPRDDLLAGDDFANSFQPGPGSDTLHGGEGTDILYLDSFNNGVLVNIGAGQVFDGPDTDTFTGIEQIVATFADDTVQGGLSGDIVDGNAGHDWLEGGFGSDTLKGGDGNDTVLGDGDDDLLSGGAGNDFIDGGDGNDTLDLSDSFEPTYADLGLSFTFIGADADTLISIEHAFGSILSDTIWGGGANNRLDGSDGDDMLGGEGGNDTLHGGKGSDTLNGGSGTDLAVFDSAVNADLDAGFALSGLDADALFNIENLEGSDGDDTLIGNALDNVLSGGGGSDLLTGGSGADTLVAFAGNDTVDGGLDVDTLQLPGSRNAYTINRPNAIESVFSEAGTGRTITTQGIEWVQFADGEFAMQFLIDSNPTAGNDTLVGDAGHNLIDGLAGNDSISGLGGDDTLIGGPGIDTLVGGPGDDVFRLDVLADQVVEFVGEGVDRVEVGVALAGTYALPIHVDHATVVSAVAVNLIGNELPNRLVGNAAVNQLSGGAGDDTLDGGAGNDSLAGGPGNDFYVLSAPTDAVNESAAGSDGFDAAELRFTAAATYVLPAGLEQARVETGNALAIHLTGNALDNWLQGGPGNNTLDGGAGSDALVGGAGNDRLIGGADNDMAYYTDATGPVSANLGTGVVTGGAGSDTLVGIESLYASDFDDTLVGTADKNRLYGGEGNDSLSGGKGDDWFLPDAGNDRVAGDDGIDTVSFEFSGVGVNVNLLTGLATGEGSDTLTGIEAVLGSSHGDTLVGDGGSNVFTPGEGNDSVTGGGGFDQVVVSANGEGAMVNLVTGIVTSDTGSDTLSGIESVWATRFADTVLGSAGDDSVDGREGNDTMTAGLGDDRLLGGAGNDTLRGEGGSDWINGGKGSDSIDGGDGIDLVDYGDASALSLSLITGHAASGGDTDTLVGIEQAEGSAFNDTLVGNAADNLFDGHQGNDFIDGGAGLDTASFAWFASAVNASLATGTATGQGADTLVGIEHLDGSSQNDTLTGDGNANRLFGGKGMGNDSLAGGSGNDTLGGGGGKDTVDGEAGEADLLVLSGALADYTLLRTTVTDVVFHPTAQPDGTQDTLARGIEQVQFDDGTRSLAQLFGNLPTAFDDTLTGTPGPDSIDGLPGSDSLDGLAGNDTLQGSAGNDTLIGGEGADLLIGGIGVDSLVGGADGDVYNVDVPGDVIVEAAGGGDDLVQVAFTAAGTYVLPAEVEFAVVTTGPALAVHVTGNAKNNLLQGSAGNNSLVGGEGLDTLNGQAGIDTMVGGAGNDQYQLSVPADVVTEAIDGGIDVALIQFTAPGTYILAPNLERAVDETALAVNQTGNALDNQLTGGAGANSLSGGLGADTLFGGPGNDTLAGGEGNDSLAGEGGTDNLLGDAGDDTLDLRAGDGNDTADGGAGTLDTAVIPGNLAAYAVSRPTATDTVLTGASQVFTLRNVERVAFDDGTRDIAALWVNTASPNADLINGTAGPDALDGLAGNDTLIGLGGDDTLIGGAGVDSLVGGPGHDTFEVDVPADVVVEALDEGTDQVNVRFGVAGTYTLPSNVERGVVTAAPAIAVGLTGNALPNLLVGNAAANALIGGPGDDTLDGGAGADNLAGGAGNDTYVINLPTEIVNETAPGSDGIDTLSFEPTAAGSHTLAAGVENAQVRAANALVVNLTGNALPNTLNGHTGNNSLSGAAGDDTFVGSDGADTVDGGLGDDLLQLPGSAADYALTRPSATQARFAGPGGSVLVSAVERVQFGASPIVTLASLIASIGSTGADTLVGGAGSDTLDGVAGNDSLDGGAGADSLLGGPGNDTLSGGPDTDVLDGGDGSDTYAFALGSGLDLIEQNDPLVGSVDAIVLGAGIGAGDVAFSRGHFSFDDLVVQVTVGASVDQIVVVDFFQGDGIAPGTIDQLRLASGQVFTQAQMAAAALAFDGGNHVFVGLAGNDTITGDRAGPDTADWASGGGGADSVVGLGGDDTLFGGAGGDRLLGGAGNDLLAGGEGSDTLVGDAGNDTVSGGAGSDRYEFGLGSGADTVFEPLPAAVWGGALFSGVGPAYAVGVGDLPAGGDVDTVVLGTGITQTTAQATRVGDALVLKVTGTTDQLEVRDYFANGVPTIERVVFANGSQWSNAVVRSLVIAPTSGNDTIVGYQGGDVLTGLAGNDAIDGREGNDFINGGDGADTLTGGSGGDRFTFAGAGALTAVDTITDFVPGTDRLALSAATFTALAGAVGTAIDPDTNAFTAYNPATGAITYDADGEGVGAAGVVIALLGVATHPAALGLDILVVP